MLTAGVALAESPERSPRFGSIPVGTQPDGSTLVPTDQRLTPAGAQVTGLARPDAITVSPDGHRAAFLAQANGGDQVDTVDLETGKVKQRLSPTDGRGSGAAAGIAYAPDGRHLYASDTNGSVKVYAVAADGTLTAESSITMPNGPWDYDGYPEGLAITPDGKTMYVALSRANALAVVDLAQHVVTATVPVGNAPWGVTLAAGKVYVSNEGGRPAGPGDFTNYSSGTPIVADRASGGAATGTVSVVDPATLKQVASIPVGNHPTGMHLSGRDLFVADTNSDEISVIDTATNTVVKTISTRPTRDAPLGTSPQAVTMLPDGRLVVALGNSNALAFFRWRGAARPVHLEGLLPTGWYPSDVALDPAHSRLIVSNLKGLGSVGDAGSPSQSVYSQVATASLIPTPTSDELERGTAQVGQNNGWTRGERSSSEQAPGKCRGISAPVPLTPGCSPIKHVFFIIKENRTYDQVLGDVAAGNGNPANLEFGANVTPNEHALLSRFPLLDNYYASGIASDEGHQWLNEAWVTSYLEKMEFGGPERAYPYDGGDAMAYAPSGFLWQNVTDHGKTARVYGEFANDFSGASGGVYDWVNPQVWQDFYHDSRVLAGLEPGPLRTPIGTYSAHTDVPSLQQILSPTYPPFNTASIPDQYRLQVWLREFRAYEAAGNLPSFNLFTLPQDHTAGDTPGFPTPAASVADNDLALGKMIDAISHSRDWKDSAIFVTEDDAQSGLDHVDGHRTTGFVISPYTRPGVNSTYYSQIDMVRTIEQIVGLPPMNQFDASAQPMYGAFTGTPNNQPFDSVPNQVPLDQLTPNSAPAAAADVHTATVHTAKLRAAWQSWARRTFEGHRFRPDGANDQALNRDIWYSTRGFGTRYPGDRRVLFPSEAPKATN